MWQFFFTNVSKIKGIIVILKYLINFRSGGSSISASKLEKANMTEDDWMVLTNRPDVVEKDMVKLLDWFIKVQKGRIHRF